MDALEIKDLVHRYAKADETHLVIATVDAYVDGHGKVRVEVYDKGDDGPYRYSATVFDSETGEQIATGNGGRDVEDALDSVHWQNLGRA